MKGQLRVGTSGFSYSHWLEVFYPKDLPQRQWLEYYAEHFDTVELNNTFYRMPDAAYCQGWRTRTPEGFCFVVKLNRLLTHRMRLVDCRDLLISYVEGVAALAEKLGPILVQLPPNFPADPRLLGKFLLTRPPGHRWALEFRDPSWLCEEVYAVLRAHNAALVVHDLIQDHPRVLTAGWTYLRFHGPGGHDGCYTEQMLRGVAGRIRKHLRAGRDTYVYFNNDLGGHAVNNARRLKQLVSPRRGPSSQTE